MPRRLEGSGSAAASHSAGSDAASLLGSDVAASVNACGAPGSGLIDCLTRSCAEGTRIVRSFRFVRSLWPGTPSNSTRDVECTCLVRCRGLSECLTRSCAEGNRFVRSIPSNHHFVRSPWPGTPSNSTRDVECTCLWRGRTHSIDKLSVRTECVPLRDCMAVESHERVDSHGDARCRRRLKPPRACGPVNAYEPPRACGAFGTCEPPRVPGLAEPEAQLLLPGRA